MNNHKARWRTAYCVVWLIKVISSLKDARYFKLSEKLPNVQADTMYNITENLFIYSWPSHIFE